MPIEGNPASEGPRVAERDRARTWETVLRMPFRVAFLPLRLLARGTEAGVGHFGARFLDPKPKEAPRPGFTIGPSVELGAASVNELALGPAITWTGFPTADSRVQASGTMDLDDHRRARLRGVIGEQRPVGLHLQVDYESRPDRSYYGIGNGTRKGDRAYYRLESTRIEGGPFYGASPLRRVRFLGGYSAMDPGRGYHGSPLLDGSLVFPPESVPYGRVATQDFTYGIAGDLATLDDLAVPSLGLHGRAELRQAAGLRKVDPHYRQWLLEGRAYVPVFAHRRVIALRALYTGVDPTGGTSVIPFYRLPVSETPFRFAGYASQRFRDRQLILCRIEYRWIIAHDLDAVALYELGEVAPQRRAFTLRSMHSSWGGGLRLGMHDATAARLELGKSVEGFQALLRVGGDF